MTPQITTLSKSRAARRFHSAKHRNIAILDTLENRVLLSVAPTGHIDIANRTEIVGWAYDADTPNTSITVQFNVDGATSDVTASQVRNDLTPVIGSPNHGFTFTVPTLSPGNHTITVSAADSTSGKLTLLKTIALTNPAPTGWVDVANSTTVSGWAFDPDSAAASISVRIDSNGATVNTITASNSRPDLTAVVGSPNHGFSLSGSFGVTDVYALDNPTGTPVIIGSTSVKAIGHVDILASTRIAGWAWTPDMGSAPAGIEVDVDGTLFQTNLANQSRPDVEHITGSNNNGFDFALNALPPGKHTVQIFALDTMTTYNAKVLLGSGTLTNNTPIGSLDVANQVGVSGWVFDKDAGATPISVQVKVDGTVTSTTTASLNRPDLTKVVGSPLHGFDVNYASPLAAGPHEIQIYAIDTPSGTAVLITTKFIDNTLPYGSLDAVSLTDVQGWAYDPDSPTTPVNVIVELDGSQSAPVAAGVARSDLLSVLPNDTHAFDIPTPTNLAGTHTITVLAVDTFTGQNVTLGSKTFTNHAPRGNVDVYSATSIQGWVQDPDEPTSALTVLISIDGTISETTTNVNRPDLIPVIGSANHGFDYVPGTALSAGTHFIEVFGVDPVTGVSTLIGSKSLVVP